MAFRIHKSIKLGKNVRLNLNKNSIGMSVGGKLGRYSVNSKGRSTTTVHTPIKAVRYVKTHSANHSQKSMKTGSGMLILTIFLGMFGIHRFISGQIGMGLLYFFTCGLFSVGWIYDIIFQISNLKVTVE